MDWESVEFVARVIIVPIVFIAASAGIFYGALMVVFSAPLGKLLGLAVLAAALLGYMFGLWWAFGRPKHWFAPGDNTEFNPYR